MQLYIRETSPGTFSIDGKKGVLAHGLKIVGFNTSELQYILDTLNSPSIKTEKKVLSDFLEIVRKKNETLEEEFSKFNENGLQVEEQEKSLEEKIIDTIVSLKIDVFGRDSFRITSANGKKINNKGDDWGGVDTYIEQFNLEVDLDGKILNPRMMQSLKKQFEKALTKFYGKSIRLDSFSGVMYCGSEGYLTLVDKDKNEYGSEASYSFSEIFKETKEFDRKGGGASSYLADGVFMDGDDFTLSVDFSTMKINCKKLDIVTFVKDSIEDWIE